jgi:phospholipid/cholesterol/gamma-HCH transport system substrate-binding protein
MNETTNSTEPLRGDDRGQPSKRRFEFRRVNEITGTLVLVVFIALIVAAAWTGRSQRWFRSTVTLSIVLPEDGAAGIRQGSEVYFLGTLVGTVSDVIVEPTGRMEARANIRRDFFRFVRADSSAVVKKKFGVAGDSFFEITRGEGAPLPEAAASIACNEQFESSLEAAIEEIRRETLLVLRTTATGLDTWSQLGTDLRQSRKHLDQLTLRMDNLVAGIEAGEGTAGRLITGTGLADEAQTLLERANQTMSELQSVATNLNAAVGNIQRGTVLLPEITGAVADAAMDLPGLVHQTESSMRELERLVDAMQRHWLLRKLVNKTDSPSLDPIPENHLPKTKPSKRLLSPRNL